MNVLFVTRKYPPSVGGMQLFASDLHAALAQKAKVNLVKWGGGNKALPVVYPYLLVAAFWKLALGGIDVIHLQDGLLAPIGFVLSKLFSKPYVIVIHGLDITYNNWIYRIFVLPAIKHANQIICISQAAAEQSIAKGVDKSRIEVISLAVNDGLNNRSSRQDLLNYLSLNSDSKILLTVGRLVKRKGVQWFIINVLPELVATSPDLIYLIVGEGPERKNIESAVALTGTSNNVRLLGKIEGSLYEAVYNGANLFVMPNINIPGDIEGFGLVLLEASLCSMPVVAANTEGIKDAIADGKNGILVPVQDSKAYVTEINKFLRDPAYAQKFGKQSRKYSLKHFRWDTIAKQYIDRYESLT